MRMRPSLKNFILYLLLLVLTTAGSRQISHPMQGMAQIQEENAPVYQAVSALPGPMDIWAGRPAQARNEISTAAQVRGPRPGISCRSVTLFLFYILTLLSFAAEYSKQILALYDSRSVYKEAFTISFMQDADGRKRLSYL